MKLNNKGFAITGIIYSILMLFIILMLGIFAILASRKMAFDKLKTEVSNKINGDESFANVQKADKSGANAPVLAPNMVPIVYEGDQWVVANNENEYVQNWYNYDARQWANAVTQDCATEGDFETCSMWVWIPRYIYNITSGWHSNETGTIDIQFSQGINDNWNRSSIGNIDTGSTAESSNNKWTNHPAFTFGDTELEGIWVAKFEATASEGVGNTVALDNVTTKSVEIIPSVRSWRNISIGNAFTVSRNMETNSAYGWGNTGSRIDTHLMKPTEWGVIAYLSHSKYGRPDEVWNNPNNAFITGCAGNGVDAVNSSSCIEYNIGNGLNASTTGNVYGVYDMSAGSWEYVAAYIENGNDNLNNGLSIVNADLKYKDIYPKAATDSAANNYPLTIAKKGDAVYETSNGIEGPYSWYNDIGHMPNNSHPWAMRGARYDNSTDSGLFRFSGYHGNIDGAFSFRPTLIVHQNL